MHWFFKILLFIGCSTRSKYTIALKPNGSIIWGPKRVISWSQVRDCDGALVEMLIKKSEKNIPTGGNKPQHNWAAISCKSRARFGMRRDSNSIMLQSAVLERTFSVCSVNLMFTLNIHATEILLPLNSYETKWNIIKLQKVLTMSQQVFGSTGLSI